MFCLRGATAWVQVRAVRALPHRHKVRQVGLVALVARLDGRLQLDLLALSVAARALRRTATHAEFRRINARRADGRAPPQPPARTSQGAGARPHPMLKVLKY